MSTFASQRILKNVNEKINIELETLFGIHKMYILNFKFYI